MDLEKLLKEMTVFEKAMQCTQLITCFYRGVKLEDNTANAIGPYTKLGLKQSDIYLAGSVNFLCDDTGAMLPATELERIQKSCIENSPHHIPTIFMQDIIHGYVTVYPIPLAMAASFNTDAMEECCAMAAKEASLNGVHLTIGPMVDLSREARWGRVCEGFGEDPCLGSAMARASIKGFQGDDLGKYRLATCVKHFCGYGAPEAGLDYNVVDISERTLKEYYLPNYKAAIDAGATTVMSAFNVFDGMPITGNEHVLKGILRDEWGFDGAVISDYAACLELLTHGVAKDEIEAALLSMNATCDVEMMTTLYAQNMEKFINEGKISMSQLDDACMRVLKLKEKLGLFENPYRDSDYERAKESFCCEEHREISRKAAEESIVLLKNDGILPLNKDVSSVAVIGPLAHYGRILGAWNCGGRESDAVTVYDGLCNYLGKDKVFTSRGCDIYYAGTDESEIPAAVELAKKCEVVVLCVGEDQDDSGESASKSNISLPDIQKKLFREICKANKNVVALLFNGRPMAIEDLDADARAVVDMWFPGTECGNAAANILFGETVPSGKLPMTFPRNVGQCPIYYNHYGTGRPREDDSRRCWCQSAYIDSPNAPLYPFGYGLSYTEFAYGKPYVDKTVLQSGGDDCITVRCELANTGKYDGKEVVQMYVRDMVGSVVRPVRELKGFKKVFVKRGEKVTVSFTIREEDLAFYNAKLEKRAEKGAFRVWVGGDSTCSEYVEIELV